MSTAVEKTYTPEDLLAMPDRKKYELVAATWWSAPMSQLSSWVGGQVYTLLNIFVAEHQSGWVWPADQGYACYPDAPGKVRYPDVSFIRKERLPDGLTSEGYTHIPPDLAVEVVSPNDLAYEVENKVLEYLDAGVALVWVIDPEARTVHIHRRDGSVGWLREEDELSGEDVVPGFRCPCRGLVPEKPAESPAAG